MKVTRIEEPAALVTLDQAKQHLRVDHTDEDALIQMYLNAAIGYIDGKDGILGRQLMPARYRATMSNFPINAFCLPYPPTISVERISYLDANAAETVIDPSVYRVTGLNDDEGAVVVLGAAQTWPTVYSAAEWPDRVFIEYRAGYENPDSPADNPVPAAARHAVLLLLGDFYETRPGTVVGTTAAELPFGVLTLLAPYRLYLPEACE